MKNKKILSLAFAVMMVLSSLISCSGDDGQNTTDQTASLTVENDTVPVDTGVYEIAEPSITFTENISPSEVMVVGKCQSGQSIKVNCGDSEFDVIPDGEDFLFTVSVEEDGKKTVAVSAWADGEKSRTLYVNAKYDPTAEDRGVFATLDSRLFQNTVLPDVYRTEPFSSGEIRAIKKCADDRAKDVRKATGKETQIIYLLVPYSLSVYPEGMSEEMKANITANTRRYDQVIKTLSTVKNSHVIDLTQILNENKDKGKLYYNLDTHWTELGGYFGYRAVMEYIAQTFPTAAPHSLEDYDIVDVELDYADMIYYAGCVGKGMRETAPFLHSKYTPLSPYDAAKEDVADINAFAEEFFSAKTSVTTIDDSTLPVGQIVFDSYGFNCIPFLAEHFSTLTTQPAWQYSVDLDIAAETKPDYVIYILNERSMEKLIG